MPLPANGGMGPWDQSQLSLVGLTVDNPATTGWLTLLHRDERSLLRKQQVPKWIAPLLATLTHNYFSSPDWLYERKLDGERCRGHWRNTCRSSMRRRTTAP